MLYNFKFSSAYEAPKGQTVIGTGFAIGLVLGPIVGGAFAENPHAIWRWVNLSLIFSGSHWPWDLYSAIVAWVFAGLLFSIYAVQQHLYIWTTRKHRIFPVDALKKVRTVLPVGLSTAMAVAAYGIILYYIPLFFSFTKGFEPVKATVHLLPYIGTFVGMTVLSSALLPRLRLYPVLYVLGGALMIIGGALQTSITADSPVGLVMGNLALVGAGIGLIFQQGAAVLKTLVRNNATKKSDYIVVFLIMQLGGIVLFMSVGGCIFQNLGFKYVSDALVDTGVRISDAEIRQAFGGLDSAFLGQADQGLARVVVEEISRAIGNIFFIIVGAGAVVFCLTFVMKWERFDFKPKPMEIELSGPQSS
ncbi:hypothetical protein MCOR33_011137 [Pyricularia grisea]|uniref:MFS general substrate transporter n=1 Tax=Pyricularia grisea TaxID=148305 RepID=A0ABQ8N3S9_PYRGI|nr:hypothetical protein MCOR33_011137 [Pyricularia grisea]